jgi:hypothetical protein
LGSGSNVFDYALAALRAGVQVFHDRRLAFNKLDAVWQQHYGAAGFLGSENRCDALVVPSAKREEPAIFQIEIPKKWAQHLKPMTVPPHDGAALCQVEAAGVEGALEVRQYGYDGN